MTSICGYCSNSYHDPRILACLHSYCLQCIVKIHEDTTTITCPTCNYTTPLPTEGGIASLPSNIRLKEQINQDNIVQRVISSPSKCDSCDDVSDDVASIAYCKDCDDMLCAECWTIHKRIKITKFHSTFALEDLKKMNVPELQKILSPMMSSVPMCPDHDDQKLSFYCTTCCVPVCIGCTVDKHNKDNGHLVQEISTHVTQAKTNILQEINRLPDKRARFEQVMENIDNTKKQIKIRKTEVDDVLRKAFAILRQLIDEREKSLLTENSQIALSKATRLSIQQEDIQRLSESINQCYSLASVATNEYSDVQLVSIAHTLHNRAVSLQQQFTNIPLDMCQTSAEVNTNTLADMITEFGNVIDSNPNGSTSTAIVPRQRLGIGAEMKVRVITRDSRGKEITKGGAIVTCSLDGKGCVDEGNGTYLISVIPRQLGQHQLSITVNGQHIQNSPFSLTIVPQRDYTKLIKPVQTITDINGPHCIAFSNNGDMFVTSDHCIHVYDKSGNKKTTIGSKGSGELQFNRSQGIDINGEIVYVAEFGGDRIHKLTTGGAFISTFGHGDMIFADQGLEADSEECSLRGSEKGFEESSVAAFELGTQEESSEKVIVGVEKSPEFNHDNDSYVFNCPADVKIGPDNKIYVADSFDGCVQVFHSDWTISHVINGGVSGDGGCAEGIAFDLSGNVHITGSDWHSVAVFTPSGQFIRRYDTTHDNGGGGIAIDPSGYSLVTNFNHMTLSVFDPNGVFIHSVGGLDRPFDVSVANDGGVWVADSGNNRLVKY